MGFDCIPISPKRLKRKNNRQEQINLSYLQNYNPLTVVQAKVLVNTAIAEFEGDLQGKISNIITTGGHGSGQASNSLRNSQKWKLKAGKCESLFND